MYQNDDGPIRRIAERARQAGGSLLDMHNRAVQGVREFKGGWQRTRELSQRPFVQDTLFDLLGGDTPRVHPTPLLGRRAGGMVIQTRSGRLNNEIFMPLSPEHTTDPLGVVEEALIHETAHLMDLRGSHEPLMREIDQRWEDVQAVAQLRESMGEITPYAAVSREEHRAEAFAKALVQLRTVNIRLESEAGRGTGRPPAEVVNAAMERADSDVPGASAAFRWLLQHDMYKDSPAARALNPQDEDA
jgi:hypothetical protein